MVVSRRFPPRSGLRLCVLGLPSREDLAIPAQRNTPPPRWSVSGDSLEQGIAREMSGPEISARLIRMTLSATNRPLPSITASSVCLPERRPACPKSPSIPPWHASVALCLFSLVASSEEGTIQHPTDFSIAFPGYTGPAVGSPDITGFLPVVTGED